jgi:hypothetical protein
MKTIKHTLLILTMVVIFVSCGNDGVNNEETSREMIKKKKDSIRRAEEAKNTSFNYEKINVDMEEVKYVWQKNLLWFLARHLTP